MDDLRQMWEIGGLIEDQNNDQVADRVNVWVDLGEKVFPDGLIDFCARLGFETTSLSFDFLEENERYPIKMAFIKSEEETAIQCQTQQLTIYYEDEEKVSDLLRFLAGKWRYDFIEGNTPIKKIGLINGEVVIQGVAYPVDFENTISDNNYQINSLTDVWNDLGFLHGTEPSPNNGHTVTFVPSKEIHREAWIEIYYAASRVGMESTSLAFPMTGNSLKHPLQFHFRPNMSESATVQLENNVIQFSGERKSLTHAISYFFREKHWSLGGHFGAWEKVFHALPTEDEVLFSDTWDDDGEVEELYRNLDELHSNVKGFETLDINVFISESEKSRHAIKKTIEKQFPQGNVYVRSAFKPGYFWLTEEVLTNLIALKEQVNSVKIYCLQEEKKDALELPIRWIQELYPVDEIIANELQVDPSKVGFELSTELDSTYKVVGYDVQGNTLFKDHIEIPVSRVPYVEEGKYSYPTTSNLTVCSNGQLLVQDSIQTDRERFYMYYLKEILPKLWNKIGQSDENSGYLKPLFDRIEIEVEMSEEEKRLSVAEERISPLEALHEDLYFNTLDYFLVNGEQSTGKGYTAPGGVYPFIHVTSDKKPKAKITAYKWIDRNRQRISTKTLFFDHLQPFPTKFQYQVEGNSQLVMKMVDEETPYENIPNDVPKPRLAQIHPWLAEYSYQGRPILVYEFFNTSKEDYYSAIKLSALKPTVLIETGHHANEVSSMPAVVEMLDEIIQKYPKIIKHMNLVVIPRANPDGVALHQRMVADNPEWKHHAARYNAVGLEFSDVRYQESIFGEANVVPKIMNRWAPDIIIDDHGIPSHEWTQPFAGYHIPPRFNMSFWIPNAMIYGIARKLDEKKYPEHAAILNKITHSIQHKINQTGIHKMNQYWKKRYEKYGHHYLPEMFPIESMEEFIFYKWPTEPHAENTSAISRFPDWVSADLISEAADETVYGDVLDICKEAHRLFDLGAIEWIDKDVQKINRLYLLGEVGISRSRPLTLKKDD